MERNNGRYRTTFIGDIVHCYNNDTSVVHLYISSVWLDIVFYSFLKSKMYLIICNYKVCSW